jgi:hypothetical protein
VSFKALVGNLAATPAVVECYLRHNPVDTIDQSAAPLFAHSGEPGSWQTMTLLATQTTPVPDTFYVECYNSEGNGFVQFVWLVATKVGALH